MSLTPEYLNVDFSTLVSRLREELSESNEFRDYDYEGSNISVILELMAYIGALTTYYTNKLASNAFFDTVEVYENAHRLAEFVGYHPKGHRASRATVDITITNNDNINVGDTLMVPAWKEITSTETYDSESIVFSTTIENTFVVDELPYTFELPVRQGYVQEFTGIKGSDLIDNEYILNFDAYAYDDDLEDDTTVISVYVNDEEWERVDDFYDEVSGLYIEPNVYRFKRDKYGRYLVSFSSARSVPENNDDLIIKVIKTMGSNGAVGSETITDPEDEFVYNQTEDVWIDDDYITVTNSSASYGENDPDDVDDIKEMAPRILHSQFRNVTKTDYETYLENRSDIDAAGVWGEKEISPSGNVQEFNKVYISLIPSSWGTSTISTAVSGGFVMPVSYSDSWKSEISEYLEPRKMLCAYEHFEIPQLVYFYYDIGLKVKRTYDFDTIVEDVKDKLEYYFSSTNRSFNETISFIEIINFILDETETSSTNDFENVVGIRNMVIRDINTNRTIYEPNTSNNYPQYTVEDDTYLGVNKVRNIEVGYDQFPMIDIDKCNFTTET